MTPERSEIAGSARYWAWLYSPPRARAVLEAVIAVESQINSALAPGLDHHVAHVRLDWWRDECARYAQGAPLHPVMRALLAACDCAQGTARLEPSAGAADRGHPEGLVDTALWDLASATFETRAQLADYCERWAQAVTETAARGIAQDALAREEAGRFGRTVGVPLKELELLGNLAADARLGRLRVPLEELERAGIDPSIIARPPWPPALSRLLGERHRAARAAVARSLEALPAPRQPTLRGLLVWAAVAHRRSRLAERSLPRPWEASVLERLGEVGSSWRAARRAERRVLRL